MRGQKKQQSAISWDWRRTASLAATPIPAVQQYLERMPGLTVDDVLESPFLLIGTLDQMAAKLQRLRDEFGITYFVAFEGALESLAPVIHRLRATT